MSDQWCKSETRQDIRDAIAADVARQPTEKADTKIADTNPYIMAMMRGEGHAYLIMQNRLMADLAKAHQMIGMLNEQVDEAERERDEARRDACEWWATSQSTDGLGAFPDQYAKQRGWDCFHEEEES